MASHNAPTPATAHSATLQPIRIHGVASLPALVDRAVKALSSARSAAEVLEARDLAGIAYDAAKKMGRLAKAKQAHDELISAAYRAQANALEIDAQAKRRLADEYDAAQGRGEVQRHGGQGKRDVPEQNIPTVADLGLSRKGIHEARQIRDAEEEEPGIVRRALDDALEGGEEPTRAKVKRAIKHKSRRGGGARYSRRESDSPIETQHDRDLRSLLGIWESACASARSEFLETIGPGRDAPPHDDIGPNSAGELQRRDVRNDELEAQINKLKLVNDGLCREMDRLKALIYGGGAGA